MDIPRLRKVLEYIEELNANRGLFEDFGKGKPVTVWCQPTWLTLKDKDGNTGTAEGVLTDQGVLDKEGMRCGTAACFAGHAVLMFGEPGTRFTQYPSGGSPVGVVLPSGERTSIPEYARELLGLDEIDAHSLFWAANSLAKLREIVEEFAAQDEA